MLRLIFLTTVFLLSVWGCQDEPYVDQINKAHDIINEAKLNNSKELFQQAAEEYQKAYSYALFALEKKYDALFNLGLLHAFNGEFQHCIDIFNQAYKLRRNEPNLYYYWGMCYANESKISLKPEEKNNNLNEAENIYRLGLELNPNDPQINYGLGILYGFIKEDYNLGIEFLNKAQLNRPNEINTLFALANLHYKIGSLEESAEYFQTIMRLSNPDSPSYKQAKANLDKIR